MTVLITFICVTLFTAGVAGSFIYGRQIGYIQRDAEVKAKEMQEMQEQIKQMQLEYLQLETQYKQEKQDNHRSARPGGWDPDQLGTR